MCGVLTFVLRMSLLANAVRSDCAKIFPIPNIPSLHPLFCLFSVCVSVCVCIVCTRVFCCDMLNNVTRALSVLSKVCVVCAVLCLSKVSIVVRSCFNVLFILILFYFLHIRSDIEPVLLFYRLVLDGLSMIYVDDSM